VYSNWEILPWLLLGLLAGVFAPWFLRLLRASEKLFSTSGIPIYLRLAAGGLIVGALAFFHPEVCGNGYSVIGSVLKDGWLWQTLLVVLVLKLLATAATFGSGAVGGVFTPTLFVGACLGYIFAHLAQLVCPAAPLNATASTLIGMGAFLAATTHAPIMAIIMLFELTLDYQIILPLMLACVIAHYTSRAFETDSIYSESLMRKGAGWFRERLADLRVVDLMKPNPPAVSDLAAFNEIAHNFLTHRFHYLYVVDGAGSFKGVVSLHDVKSYLNDPALAGIVIAKDILQEKFPTIAPGQTLVEALDEFSRHPGERLPVTDGAAGGGRLLGSISKSDVMLALVERAGQESKADTARAPAAATGTL
ncbi:MAG: chloride channel protein, partial [Verrucomicrobiota bacterium]|nr:chloride channel protein [Verrucomicrobiota bacterium]